MQYGKFAALYDKLMADVDYGAWADYVAKFIKPGSSVLECACGTGEISLRLAAKGYSVTATDVSEEMLAVAAEKQRRAGLAMSSLRFVRMDMRSLSVHKKVDCVLSCCDGVNYLTSTGDLERFFMGAASVLKPGGLLLFDISSRYKLANVLGNNCFAENGMDAAYIWRNAYDEKTKLVEMELTFFERKGGLYERFDETHIQRAHSVREIGSRLERAGFSYEAYACFTEDAPSDTDERIQFAARKL